MTTITIQVQQFAAAVRARLHDLPEETVEELTDGLEADLAERLEERGGDLGDAAAYAEELRTAAGLPAGRRGLSLHDRRVLEQVKDFLAAIRPAWWVLRGIAVGMLLGVPFLGGFAWVTVGLVLATVVLSVQWGRGRWSGLRGAAALTVAFGLLALLGGAVTAAYAQFAIAQTQQRSWQETAGIWVNGAPIGNIIAYSCEGEPLDGVQLFDGFGTPIAADPLLVEAAFGPAAPNRATGDEPQWNVFPLVDYGVAGEPAARVPALEDCAPSADEQR